MVDDQKKVDSLTPYVQRLNKAEEEELNRLGYALDKEGNLLPFEKKDQSRPWAEMTQKYLRKDHWTTQIKSKVFEKLFSQTQVDRRTFLKMLGGAGAASMSAPNVFGDLGEIFSTTKDSHPLEIKNQELRETERSIATQVLEYAREFLLEQATERNVVETIQDRQHVTDLASLSLPDLLSTLSEYYRARDLETTPAQKLADRLRLHFLATSALVNLFEDPTVTEIRQQYRIDTLGKFIQWYGTIFCTGEFFNILQEIVVDYQDDRGRCIAGRRPDAALWANQISSLFVKRFTSYFRVDFAENTEFDPQQILESELARLSLTDTDPSQISEHIFRAASRALIKVLAYSDKFCSSANHRSSETTIGLEDTVQMIQDFDQETFLGGNTLERNHSMLQMTYDDEIPGVALERSADQILGIYAYTAQKNSDGSLNTSDRGGQAVNFWLPFGRPNGQGTWQVLPEGVLAVTVSETSTEMTIAVGGENDGSIRDIHNALLSGEAFHPSLRADGLTQETSSINLNNLNEIHLGRMMAKDYVECFRVQRSRVNEIQIGLSQRNLDTDTHAQKLSQTHWNWMQMRFAEINQTVLSASLDTLTETNDQDSMFQNIRALLLSARPGLETEQPHLNTQVYFMMLLKVFNFFSFMSENSTSDGTELQEGLTTLLTQEAMAPNNSQDYYRSLLRSGLTQPNPSEYQPFSLSRNVSPSEVNFPLVTMRMQEGIFRSIASQSREAGQPKIFFCATDLFNSLGETENHFTQIVEHTRWAIRFNMQDHQIIFYVNEGDGVFKQYQIDDEGIHHLENISLTAENYREQLSENTYFVGRPPKVNP